MPLEIPVMYSEIQKHVQSTLVLGAYDVANAFCSLIDSQAILELHSRGVSLDAIFLLYYMYRSI